MRKNAYVEKFYKKICEKEGIEIKKPPRFTKEDLDIKSEKNIFGKCSKLYYNTKYKI